MMKVKIKALRNDPCGGYKIGDVFDASRDHLGNFFYIDHDGDKRMTISEAFTIIDEPVIEVGSEWLADHMPDEVATVKYVGREKVFIEWLDGSEGDQSIEIFLKDFKPKPKTVTMYFYKEPNGKMFADENILKSFNVLFTREIELP